MLIPRVGAERCLETAVVDFDKLHAVLATAGERPKRYRPIFSAIGRDLVAGDPEIANIEILLGTDECLLERRHAEDVPAIAQIVATINAIHGQRSEVGNGMKQPPVGSGGAGKPRSMTGDITAGEAKVERFLRPSKSIPCLAVCSVRIAVTVAASL